MLPLQGVIKCYKVLQSVTKCYKMLPLQGVTKCYKMLPLQGVTKCYKVLQGVTKCYKMLQNVTSTSDTILLQHEQIRTQALHSRLTKCARVGTVAVVRQTGVLR